MNSIVIIPTYNEVDNIQGLLTRILSLYPDIVVLIVDDNSPDGTGRLVDKLSQTSERIKILHHAKKMGLGRAYAAGFKYALSQGLHYKRIIQMDSDFSHAPEQIADLLRATEQVDVGIGSRYIASGSVQGWHLSRRLQSYCANLYAQFLLGNQIKDWTSGFRCFRSEVLATIGIETISSRGYLFQVELLYRCLRHGYKLREVPITFKEREEGKTKLGIVELLEAIVGLHRLKFFNQDYAYKNSVKIPK